MNGYQRTTRAIERKPGAPVARGELVIDRQFALDLINWRGGNIVSDGLDDTDLLLTCCRLLNLDLVCISSQETMCKHTVLAPSPTDIEKIAAHGLFVFRLVEGAFQSAITERGMMDVMTDLARSPGAAAEELRQRSEKVITGMTAGAHGFMIADDIAYRQGTLMAPEFIERCMLPLWKDQANAAHDLGVPVFFHSDGNLNAVLPFIVEAGFDGLQCIEPAAGMDIGAIKAQYGKALCLMGNVDPALLHASGDGNIEEMDDLKRAVSKVMAAADGNGGLIFGTCSGLYNGMQPEQVHHMYRIAAKLDPAAATEIR